MDYPFMIDDYNFVRDRDTCHIIIFFLVLKKKFDRGITAWWMRTEIFCP